jgi:hypothetical protein
MKTFRVLLACWLLALSALPAPADIVHTDAPGLTLYARIRTGATTSVTAVLTEGTSNGVGYYVAADSVIDDVLTTAGTYTYKVFSGSPSASADHPQRGVGTLPWTGAAEVNVADNRIVKRIGTGDNAETIIEAAAAGTLCVFSPGAHTINAKIAVPSGVDITAVSRSATSISGDPGATTDAIFYLNGTNRISNLTITLANDGAGFYSTNGGAACDTVFENVYIKGEDDCMIFYPCASGRHRVTVIDSVIDSTVFDGIGLAGCNVDCLLRGVRFLGSFRPVQVLMAGTTANVTVDGCVFDMTAASSGLECLSLQTTTNSDKIICRVRNTDFYTPLGKQAVLANVAANTGAVTLEDMGGCNFDESKITLTPGSGTATFTRNYPTATWAQTARTITGTGTGAINSSSFGAGAIDATAIAADAIGASELATDAIGAAEVAANAITDAEVASDVTIASVTGAVGSVTGAVGSVTGNVGGNVTGSVGSVTAAVTLPTIPTNWISANGVASDVTTELQTGLATATSIDALPTAAENTAELLGTSLAAAAAGSVEESLAWLKATMSASGVFTEPALAEAPTGGGGGVTAVAADVVDDSRTWFADGRRARNIVEVEDTPDTITFALKPDLNPNTTITTVDAVAITGAGTPTALTLTVDRSRTRAHFSLATLSTAGTYTVRWTVSTSDSQTIVTTCTLKVY